MPTYTFINNNTGEQWTEILSLSQREEFLKNNPHIEQTICAPSIGDPIHLSVKGRGKPDIGFREVLSRIKKGNPNSTVNTF